MSTAEIVQGLGEILSNQLNHPELPLTTEILMAHALARLVELERDNPELDEWREPELLEAA